MAFCLQYHRQQSDKNPRWLKIFTPYVSAFFFEKLPNFDVRMFGNLNGFFNFLIYVIFVLQYTFLQDCFDRIFEESKWVDTGE